MLENAAAEKNYDTITVAAKGSQVKGKLLEVKSREGFSSAVFQEMVYNDYRRTIQQALDNNHIDIVHMHGIDFHQYLPRTNVPALVTLHLPVSWYPQEILSINVPGLYFNCVSESQMKTMPETPDLLGYIDNGIHTDKYNINVKRRDYCLSLGRICPEKGIHTAISAARLAKTPLLIAGKVYDYPYHREYFRNQIEPQFDSVSCRFIGPVSMDRKPALLNAARCLLLPGTAPETSSLTAMEAMASGTPVIAFPSGALKEIVEEGHTGFLVNNEYEMAEAIKAADSISPEECRKTAFEKYSAGRMTSQYLELYERITALNSRLI